MKHKRPVSIVVALIALAALTGAASASASDPVLTADSYPVKYTGAGAVDLNLYGTMGICSMTFSEEAEGPEETFSATPYGSCKSWGVTNPIKANGCKFEFHPESDYYRDGEFEGTFDIGPANCGPLTVNLYLCEVSIGAQSGLSATYRNVDLPITGGGTVPGVEIEPRFDAGDKGIEYTTSAYTCGGTGTYSDGTLTNGAWKFGGENPAAFELDGISFLEEPHEPMLEASQYPAALSGEDTANEVFGFENGLTASCSTVASSGEASGASTAFALSSTYSGCQAFGFVTGSVAMNGCSFDYGVGEASGEGFDGTQSLACPAEQSVVVQAGTCTVSIPAQSFGAVQLVNGTESGRDVVSASSSASGLTYTVTKDGIGCSLNGKGTRTNGTHSASALLRGAVVGSPGSPVDIRIGT